MFQDVNCSLVGRGENWKQGSCLSPEGMNKLRYTFTKDSHIAVQMNELDTHTNSMNHKNILMSVLG